MEKKIADELLPKVIEPIPHAIVVANQQGKIVLLNRVTERLFGYSRQELLEQGIEILVPERFRAKHPDHPSAFFEDLRTYTMGTGHDFYGLRKDGTEIPIEIGLSPIETKEGLYVLVAIVDITERKRAEVEAARLAAIVEVSDEAIMHKTLEDILTAWNQGAERLYGYKADEVLGKSISLLVPPEKEDDLSYLTEQIKRGERVQHYEMVQMRKDGKRINVAITTSPVLDLAGHITGASIIAHDITKCKQAEERFRLVVEATPNAMIMVDRNGQIALVNKSTEQLFGYTQEELVGEKIEILGNSLARDWMLVLTSLRHRQAMEPERDLFGLRKDGREISIEIGLNPIEAEDGERFTLVSIIDVTERKQTELVARARDAALEAEHIKSEFLANMSHEIRTPMNAIIGMTELLLDTPLKAQQRNFVATIHSSGDALLSVINNILDFSKIEAGVPMFETVDFSLKAILKVSVDMFSKQMWDKGIELLSYVEEDVPIQLRGDPNRLQQILMNLLGNAIKFTERGEVAARIEKESETETHVALRFSVKDTGIGISIEDQSRIFQIFAQADTSTTHKYGGTGLGLAICKKLAEGMGGQIGVKSKRGQGSTFWFTAKFEKQLANSLVSPPLETKLKGLRVLIVDDNTTSRDILHRQIISWRMRNGMAPSATEALSILRREARARDPYDIVLLDMQMPGMNGVTLAKIIKADPLIAGTLLIMMLSRPVSKNKKVDVAAYLPKPINFSKLFNCLVDIVAPVFGQKPIPVPMRPPKAISSHKKRRDIHVLLVEDNDVNRNLLTYQVQKLGCKIGLATNGKEAIKILDRKNYDIVLMDCQMPVMDGYETTKEIRKRDGKTNRVPIIALTAHVLRGEKAKCLAAGMDDYLSKPIRIQELEKMIDHWALQQKDESPRSRGTRYSAKANKNSPSSPIDLEYLKKSPEITEEKMWKLFKLYQKQTSKLLEELRAAVQAGNPKKVEFSAHKIAGSSISCGMVDIVPPLRKLEQLGEQGNLENAPRLVLQIDREFKRTNDFLRLQQRTKSSKPKKDKL